MASSSSRACTLFVLIAFVALAACDETGHAPPDTVGADTDTPDGTADGTTDGTQNDGDDATVDPDAPLPDYVVETAPAPAVRRLGARELQRTYAAVVGMVPKALAQLPPDPRDFTFDRVVNAQTVSTMHAEVYDAAANEAAEWLIAERRLDDRVAACADEILPPGAPSAMSVTSGIGLAAYPDWALNPGDGNPERLMIRYAEECGVSTSFAAPVDGTYRVTLDVEMEPTFDIDLTIDGAVVTSWQLTGKHLLAYDVALGAGSHLVAFDFVYDASANPYVWVQSLTVEGPVDVGATRDASARATCLDALIDELGAAAYRRPVMTAEHVRLSGLHASAVSEGATWGDATRMVMRAILGSPKFLYLVETGTPVAPGRFALDAWQIAQRLSYAICEMPPDTALVTAAASGALATDAEIRAQAERLFALPCAAETIARFYRQWLWLDRLPQTAKDPAVYPEFTSATTDAFAREADRFLAALTFEEHANVAELYLADHSWLDEITAKVYGVQSPPPAPSPSPLVRTTLPPERSGLLTLPGVLAVTAKFSQTSPVIRGVYVLEQLLCDELPAPPDEVDTTPPELDPSATTRERWAAHSESLQCAPCHQRIDPIGFTFEEFDAMGRHRTTENGLPIDAKGAAPVLGIKDEILDGVDDLAAAIAGSDLATTCLARQWLRFALGRMEEDPDVQSIAAVAAALGGPDGSLLDGFVALAGTRAFRERIERVDPDAGGSTP